MSLLWLEGYDWLDNTRSDGWAAIQDQMQHKYGALGLSQYGNSQLVTGRHSGGTALQMGTSNAQYMYTPAINDAENDASKGGVCGFALRTGLTCIGHYLFVVRRADLWNFNIRCNSSTGELILYRSSGTLQGSFNYYLKPMSWYYIEVKWVCKNSPDGEVHLRVNGEDIGSFTGFDNYYGSSAFTGWDNVGWYNCYSTGGHQLDDTYVCNLNGSINNNFLGDIIVRTRVPNGDGSVAMTKSGGATNYENVDNAPFDAAWEDTSYVESGTATTKDLYDYENLETEDSSANIVGAQIESIVKATDASVISAKHKIKSSVTEIAKTTQNFMWNDYGYLLDIQETDPNTGSSWTPTNFDATQFGIEVA